MASALNRSAELLRVAGQGERRFDLDSLDAELRAMWKSAKAARDGGSGAICRAAMSNLVVPVDLDTHRRLAPALTEATRRHPSRLFLVEISGGESAGALTAQVAALCHLRPEGGSICSEQILLRGGADTGSVVASAVRALRIGDLPMIVLAIEPRRETPWLEELAAEADLVLVDTGRFPAEETRCSWWREIGSDPSGRIRDLAWPRLTPWRQIIAEAFDDGRLARSLAHVREIGIEFGGGPPAPPCVPLLVGWLASRLRWKPLAREKEDYILGAGRERVRVRAVARDDTAERSLRLVRLRAGGPVPLDIEFRDEARERTAIVEVRAPETIAKEVPFLRRNFVSCLVGEIHRHEPNPLLCEAARLARDLCAGEPAA